MKKKVNFSKKTTEAKKPKTARKVKAQEKVLAKAAKKAERNKAPKKAKKLGNNKFLEILASPIMIFVFCFIIGGLLIGLGIAYNFKEEYEILNVKNEDTIKEEIKNKMSELDDLKSKQNAEYEKNSTSEEYREVRHKVIVADGELRDLEADLYNVQNGVYKTMRDNKDTTSMLLLSIGAIVIVVGGGVAILRSGSRKRGKILTMDEVK